MTTPTANPPARGNETSLINLAADTFVLNRLPIGIMVFRDQQVLFANRALTDLVGYESVDALRQAQARTAEKLAALTQAGLEAPVVFVNRTLPLEELLLFLYFH